MILTLATSRCWAVQLLALWRRADGSIVDGLRIGDGAFSEDLVEDGKTILATLNMTILLVFSQYVYRRGEIPWEGLGRE